MNIDEYIQSGDSDSQASEHSEEIPENDYAKVLSENTRYTPGGAPPTSGTGGSSTQPSGPEDDCEESRNDGAIIQVDAGKHYVLALKEYGSVWAWGDNSRGQCGSGSTGSSSHLTRILNLEGVCRISAGTYHCLALKSDGTVWAWGGGYSSQTGSGGTYSWSSPVQVRDLSDVVWIAAGDSHNLAVKSDGTVWAWGNNAYGQLGDNTTTSRSAPAQVSGLTNVVSVAAGGSHSLAVTSDGAVWAWGYNKYGQLGNGTTTTSRVPVQVSGLTGVTQAAAGESGGMALKSDGTVWSWGRNNYGQLGDGTTTTRTAPVQVGSPSSYLSDVASIECGSAYGMAVKSDGTLWAWGQNNKGQLGVGNRNSQYYPVETEDISGVVMAGGGLNHSVALQEDGVVRGCGGGFYLQLNNALYAVFGSSRMVKIDAYEEEVFFTSVPDVFRIYSHENHSFTLSAASRNNYGQVSSGSPSYKLSEPYPGVSLERNSNVITVTSQAEAGTIEVLVYRPPVKCTHTITLVKSAVSEIEFPENNYIVLPESGSKAFSLAAEALDAEGNALDDVEITYSLARKNRGVSIDSSTGLVTVASNAQVGYVRVNAVSESIAGMGILYIKNVADVVFSEPAYSAVLLGDEPFSMTVTAWATDDSETAIDFAQVRYGLAEPYVGVSVDSASGTVTILPGTQPGTARLSASCEGAEASATLAIAQAADFEFTSAGYTAYIPSSGTNRLAAAARLTDALGNALKPEGVTYGLAAPQAGLSIDLVTGEIIVFPEAQAGSVQITASYLGESRSATLNIEPANPSQIAFSHYYYIAELPGDGSKDLTVSALVTDSNGETVSGADVAYSLNGTYSGVSISPAGVVTVGSEALPGVLQITAVSGGLSCAANLCLLDAPPTRHTVSATAGLDYTISFSADGMTDLSGQTFVLHYDANVLQPSDLCAFTHEKELSAGEIARAGLTVLSVAPGEIVFSVSRDIPAGKMWAGALNAFRFTASVTQSTVLELCRFS